MSEICFTIYALDMAERAFELLPAMSAFTRISYFGHFGLFLELSGYIATQPWDDIVFLCLQRLRFLGVCFHLGRIKTNSLFISFLVHSFLLLLPLAFIIHLE